jgi:peptidylprolyl isomerase
MPNININADTCSLCFLDFDLDNHRSKLATAAAFVDATDSRYGFSSKDLRRLGGSELARVSEAIENDHEWASKHTECGGIETKPPVCGNRIVVKLFWDVAPMACENFSTLCANGSSFGTTKPKPAPMGESGKPLTYRDSKVHRVQPGFVVQGGDFVFGNGSGGESIFNGKKFKDERAGLALKHDRRGILSMGNSGKNSNSSQWFLTFDKAPQCDGKHVVFGELISGSQVLDEIEKLGSSSGEPTKPVSITDCGIFTPFETPGSGYWLDQPDAEAFTGISPVFVVWPRVAIIAPTEAVAQKFQSAMGASVSVNSSIAEDKFEGSDAIVERISELLGNFHIDLIVIAPASSKIKDLVTLPKSWEVLASLDQVLLESKPVDALSAVTSKSWIVQREGFQFDWS